MLEHLWIPITIAAALLQCLRTAQQRRLKGVMSTDGANFVRYAFGAPLALAALGLLATLSAGPLPTPGPTFLVAVVVVAVAQILATQALLIALADRNFAVGTALSKTEAIQAAVVGAMLFGEAMTAEGWLAIGVGVVGVVLLSLPKGSPLSGLWAALGERPAFLGMLSGSLFAITGFAIREAAMSLDADLWTRSMTTLAAVTGLQTVLMAGWLAATDRRQFHHVARHWRPSLAVGVMSVAGSAGWFTAFTLQNPAWVRSLGQVELLFTLFVARLWLGESPTRREQLGTFFVGVSVIGVLIYH